MAIRFFDGFGIDELEGGWVTAPGNYGSGTYGRTGGGARVGDTPAVASLYRYDTARVTIFVGAAMYVQDGAPGEKLARFGNSSDVVLDSVQIDYDSLNENLIIKDAGGTSQGTTSVGSLPEQEWHYVEIKVTCNNTTGSVVIDIDGTNEANITNIDTQGGATATLDDVRYGAAGGSDIDQLRLDDCYFADTVEDVSGEDVIDFIGDVQVVTLFPDGNGNSSGLTGQDADSTNNYLNVDETTLTPDGDTTYNGGGTQGNKDTYTMDDTDTGNTVYSTMVTNWAKKTDTGTKHGRNLIRRSSVDYTGTSEAMTTSYLGYFTLWNQDPSTSQQWTATNLNAAEAGFEVRDS